MVLKSSEGPLSPDAFTRFQSKAECHYLNRQVKKAYESFKKSMYEVARSLPSVLRLNPKCLVAHLHSNGINLRFLGELFDIVCRLEDSCEEEKNAALNILLSEMIFRSSKATLRWALLHSSSDNAKSIAFQYLNLLRMIGNGADSYFGLRSHEDDQRIPEFLNGIRHPSQPRWNNLFQVLKDKFGFDHFEMVHREIFAENPILTQSIVARVAEACGVCLSSHLEATTLQVRSKVLQ